MPIHLLDENTINKIAAGEVVDRPSSIVKELVENAIDAGANAITVEIKDGGISMIRITDNGCGIPADEIRLAFTAHATSKIRDAADLASITSLGFRGEALSSICAVAQVELITKVRDSLTGSHYEIEGSEERSFEQVGAPDGTTFIIRNLFYNTPARRKFLKSPTTEAGYISSLLEHLSMSHPEISFRLIMNGQPKLQTVGNGKLKDVIFAIYGKEITTNLLEVNYNDDLVRIHGYIGKPLVSRGNRSFENYFINSRYVKSNIVMKAIEDAYAPYIMMHKYPFCAFMVEVAPELIDVNVHPSKMELRFADSIGIYQLIKDTLGQALAHKELIPAVEMSTPKIMPDSEPVLPQQDSNEKNDSTWQPEVTESRVSTPPLYVTKTVEPDRPKPSVLSQKMPEPFEVKRNIDYREEFKREAEKIKSEQLTFFDKEDLLEPKNEKNIRIVGQVFDTYWIVEFEKNMYMIDQHAAHEKVKFEQFMKAYEERQITSQQICPPVVLSLTLQEQQVLEKNLEYFIDFGFEIEEFGGDSYAIRAIPSDFTQADPSELFMEILDSIQEDIRRQTPESIKDKIATMSCKAAVKGGNQLSEAEVRQLLHDLMNLENPYNCPHGRPTMITMSQYELEKKFKRIV